MARTFLAESGEFTPFETALFTWLKARSELSRVLEEINQHEPGEARAALEHQVEHYLAEAATVAFDPAFVAGMMRPVAVVADELGISEKLVLKLANGEHPLSQHVTARRVRGGRSWEVCLTDVIRLIDSGEIRPRPRNQAGYGSEDDGWEVVEAAE